MDKETTENEELNQLIKDLGFSGVQKQLVRSSRVSRDAQINRSRTISEIYLTNRLEEFVRQTIDSNEKLAASNDRFSKAANWLTAGLRILAILQLVVAIIVPLISSN